MTDGRVDPPPTYEIMIEKDGKARLPWLLFFEQIFRGDSGTAWTPAFTNLTTVGAAPTITGRVYQIGRSLAYFSVRIVPGTNTSAVAGSTYINNFPLRLNADGACQAVSGLLGTVDGMCDRTTNRIYPPAWTTVTVPLTITGTVEAS